jgi:hypothetical protein
MKRKHTLEYLNEWLRINGYTFQDLKQAYHRNTGKNVTADDVLEDSTTTWNYYLNVC